MFKKIILIAAMAMLSIGAQVGTASADLVNGGFETGDFTGWTLTNADYATYVIGDSSSPSTTAHSGNSEALLGMSGSPGTISQSMATTAGQVYTVNFWLANDGTPQMAGFDGTGTVSFMALWNGVAQNIKPLVDTNTAFPYTQYQFTAIADASGASTVGFEFQHDTSTFHLDDVSATPTPIPAAAWLLGSGLMGLVGLRRKTNA
jgi:hypothetical protein